jgi:hypothetical protein
MELTKYSILSIIILFITPYGVKIFIIRGGKIRKWQKLT